MPEYTKDFDTLCYELSKNISDAKLEIYSMVKANFLLKPLLLNLIAHIEIIEKSSQDLQSKARQHIGNTSPW